MEHAYVKVKKKVIIRGEGGFYYGHLSEVTRGIYEKEKWLLSKRKMDA